MSVAKVKDASGNVITETSFYVGAEVSIHKHCFLITSADDKTTRLMEERSASGFPFSDAAHASELLAGQLKGRWSKVREALRNGDQKVCTGRDPFLRTQRPPGRQGNTAKNGAWHPEPSSLCARVVRIRRRGAGVTQGGRERGVRSRRAISF